MKTNVYREMFSSTEAKKKRIKIFYSFLFQSRFLRLSIFPEIMRFWPFVTFIRWSRTIIIGSSIYKLRTVLLGKVLITEWKPVQKCIYSHLLERKLNIQFKFGGKL